MSEDSPINRCTCSLSSSIPNVRLQMRTYDPSLGHFYLPYLSQIPDQCPYLFQTQILSPNARFSDEGTVTLPITIPLSDSYTISSPNNTTLAPLNPNTYMTAMVLPKPIQMPDFQMRAHLFAPPLNHLRQLINKHRR